MAEKNHISVIGGDLRSYHAAVRLREAGFSVALTGFESLASAEAFPAAGADEACKERFLLLPLPFSKDQTVVFAPFAKEKLPIETIADRTRKEQTVFAGAVQTKAAESLRRQGARLIDYQTDEAFALRNACFTAEGLFAAAVQKTQVAVNGSEAAVVGFGRIGFYTARLLRAAGANVTVFARSETARTKARLLGCGSKEPSALKDGRFRFDYLINTVPAGLLGFEALKNLNDGCVLFEAAGAPYGIDRAAAERLGLTVFTESGVPGKTAPKSAGFALADTVLKLIPGVIP